MVREWRHDDISKLDFMLVLIKINIKINFYLTRKKIWLCENGYMMISQNEDIEEETIYNIFMLYSISLASS
jgi:hypothetical protein